VSKPAWVVNSPSVVSETIDGELVVMNLETGNYFSSVGAGALVWSCIERRLPEASIVAALSAAFEVQADVAGRDLAAFVAQLRVERLIRDGSATEGAVPTLAGPRAAYAAPELKVYSDMKDLLMLDPIHDVAPEGWPTLPDDIKKAG
jgi:hypothetical protein